jgi:hypothetical protein
LLELFFLLFLAFLFQFLLTLFILIVYFSQCRILSIVRLDEFDTLL